MLPGEGVDGFAGACERGVQLACRVAGIDDAGDPLGRRDLGALDLPWRVL
ncbi:hypothetical protein [Corynebacterium silvaticum]|uniref:Uncharacterized protein n=1 Tax=Corynebacterium silvaticum TaxID=2320431 RepID=A0ACD4PYY1_9CORY|nr:hypothetical protein [Corynebacterium silvaticum]MBH5300447.1 hypothetical protein [Corynebacterium silvaticum]NOM64646.1 hypothetical protein [Corynebacterium silvaticum]NON69869.1 hypothetical protein [Corynebacterium silvaticum]UWH01009.1 hypothetical protein K1I39_04530 [Corynebacterium silvaticum]UWH03055.1 hypothetical protein K1I38_04545 [Corynebacterium silvaticum]